MKMLFTALLCVVLMATSAFAQKTQAIEFDDFSLHNGRTAVADGGFVTVNTSSTVGFDVSISGTSATVLFRVSGPGRFGWNNLQCFPSDSQTPSTTATASGFYQCNVAGGDVVSARVDECTSCTVTVIARRTTAVLGGGGGGGGGGGISLPGTTIFTSEATPLKICGLGALTDDCYYIYVHSNGTPTIVAVKDGVENDRDIVVTIGQNHSWMLNDYLANNIQTVTPAAASPKLQLLYGTNFKPLKTINFHAGALSVDGTNCVAPAEATPLASGVKLWTILCADNDSSRMHLSGFFPDNYDGGTVTVEAIAVQTAASAGVIEYQTAGQCKGDTEALVTTANYGSEVVWTDTMTGSSGVNRATSGAVTLAGTCAAGDFFSMYVDIGATNTTTAMGTVHILGFRVKYKETSPSH